MDEPSESWDSPFSGENSCNFQKYRLKVFVTNGFPHEIHGAFLPIPINDNIVGWSMHHKGGSPNFIGHKGGSPLSMTQSRRLYNLIFYCSTTQQ